MLRFLDSDGKGSFLVIVDVKAKRQTIVPDVTNVLKHYRSVITRWNIDGSFVYRINVTMKSPDDGFNPLTVTR